MRNANPSGQVTAIDSRRTSPFADEPDYGRSDGAGRRRALWLVPLVIISLGAMALATWRYLDRPARPVADVGQVIKEITFESGSLTDISTGAARVRGLLLEREMAMKGLYSAMATGASSYLEQPLPGTADLYMSFYIRLLELPVNGDLRLVRLSAGDVTVGNLLFRNGRLRLRVDKGSVGADSDPLLPGEMYRIGMHQRAGTGNNAVLEAYLARGDMPFTAPFAATTRGTWTEGANRMRVGMTTNVGVRALLDDLRIHADDMPVPAESR